MPDKTKVGTHFTGEERAALMREIFTSAKIDRRLRDFTDEEIGELLFHHVWANIAVQRYRTGAFAPWV